MSCGVQCRVKSSPSQRRRIEMLKHVVNVVSQYRPFAADVMRASEERQQSHGVREKGGVRVCLWGGGAGLVWED